MCQEQRPPYNPDQIESKWQKKWAEEGTFCAQFPSDKPKFYGLIEFPYPSGAGLHVGHPRSYTAMEFKPLPSTSSGGGFLLLEYPCFFYVM